MVCFIWRELGTLIALLLCFVQGTWKFICVLINRGAFFIRKKKQEFFFMKSGLMMKSGCLPKNLEPLDEIWVDDDVFLFYSLMMKFSKKVGDDFLFVNYWRRWWSNKEIKIRLCLINYILISELSLLRVWD